MKYLRIIISIAIILLTVFYNLWLYYPETRILADPNDNIFQYALVYRTNWVWENYGCPLSPSCLPNLTDHVVTAWAEGYSLPFYYSHIPQITIVASYKMLVYPLVSQFNPNFSLYEYYNFTKYLLLCLFPISVFLALKIAGFRLIPSAIASFFAAHFSTDGLYGIDPPSFLWRGWGLTSQLYAMVFMPLALAFAYRAITRYSENKQNKNTRFFHFKDLINLNTIFAVIFISATTAGHLGMGMMSLISVGLLLFIDFNWINLKQRFLMIATICTGVFFLLAYWIIPILLFNGYHMVSFWDPIWKFDSYGWYEVVRQFLQGEIFDWKRYPVITLLVLFGLFSILSKNKKRIFGILFIFWMLMYFGKTTWGSLIYLIPGMKDFHLHRFIVGVQIVSLFLLPQAIESLFELFKKLFHTLISEKALKTIINSYSRFRVMLSRYIKFTPKNYSLPPLAYSNIANLFYLISILTFLFLTSKELLKATNDYAKYNTKWIDEANVAYKQDEKNFQNLTKYLNTLPPARIYSGRPGNWGKDFKLGSSQVYMLLSVYGFDTSQFLPETWSPLSENEQNFDERTQEDYDLLNIRYLITNQTNPDSFPKEKKKINEFGMFPVYEVPTTGWFDVVNSVMSVKTDKTNFINLVHYWHKSWSRRWKMHPLISVDKNPQFPENLKRSIQMVDEVTYKEGDATKNIFADFPFEFPEATASGKILDEKVQKQVYSGTIKVDDNCKNCFGMFKMSYHPNWKVKVDGKPAVKYAVMPYYLATPLSPGTHKVEFYYQPNTLKVILLFSEIIILIGSISYGLYYLIKDYKKKKAYNSQSYA